MQEVPKIRKSLQMMYQIGRPRKAHMLAKDATY